MDTQKDLYSLPVAYSEPATAGPPNCAVAPGSVPSRFVDREGTLRRAEAWCEDIDSTEEQDRYWDEHMALALWDELRRLRKAVRYLANECDPERNGFLAEFPDMREITSPNVKSEPTARTAPEQNP